MVDKQQHIYIHAKNVVFCLASTQIFFTFFWIFFFIFSLQSKNFGMEHHIKFNVSIFLNSCITFFNDDGGLLFIVVVHSIFIFQEKEIVDLFKLIFNDFVFLRFESLANLIWRELFKHLQLSLIKGLERLCFCLNCGYYFERKKHHHVIIISPSSQMNLFWIGQVFDLIIWFHSFSLFFSRLKRRALSSLWSENCREKEMIVVGTLLFWFWWYTRVVLSQKCW